MNAQIFALFALMAVATVMATCPEENGEHSVYLANPDDCSTYFQCDHGVAILRNCSAGTEWNKEDNVCDWPENAGCSTTVEEEAVEEEVEESVVAAAVPPAVTFPRHA